MTAQVVFNVNDSVTLGNTFRVAGAATDPTAVSLTVTNPAGTSNTYTYADLLITKVATGVYSKIITADSVGIWHYVWVGTGTAPDVADGSFTVYAVADRTLYCSVEDLADELGVFDSDDNGKFTRAISAASRQIDGVCGQRFWQDSAVVAREFYAESPTHLYLLDEGGDGISTTTGLIVKIDFDGDGTFESTLTISTDFLLLPRNAAAMYPAQPYTEVVTGLFSSAYYWPQIGYHRPGVQITAKWGWPTVPDDIRKACLIQSADLYKSKDSAFGVAGVGDMGVLRVRSGLHPTAQALVGRYARPAVG